MGRYITTELVKTGRHTVTALTRKDGGSKLPQGVKVVPVDYNDQACLVSALQGQQFLVITMAVTAPPETESNIIQAAAEADVHYVMTNCYGADLADEKLSEESMTEHSRIAAVEVEKTGVSSWIALVCGFWYEFSLITGPEWFGFDFMQKKIIFYDDGNTKVNVSTWEQCGRAVAALLSLKELPEDEKDWSPTVSSWRNKPLYVASFLVSQKDIFESWKRVTGDKDEDWTVTYQPAVELYQEGLVRFQNGEEEGRAQAMYARNFYPNGGGDFEHSRGLANAQLVLPQEDLDERTRIAKQMLDSCYSYFLRG